MFELENIIRLSKEYIEPASMVLSRAFFNDPVVCWQISDESKRKAKFHYIWKMILRIWIKLGEVYTTSENLEGIAIWHPPGMVNISYWKYILNGGFILPFRFGIKSIKKLMYVQDVNVSMRNHLMKTPYWYLGPIGVNPEHQGKGFASKLIKPMLKRIFWENLPILLETNSRKNVSIYEHFGFDVFEEIIIPKTNFISWIMIKSD